MTQLLKQCGWFKDSAHPRQETIKDMTRAMIGKDCCSWSVAKVTSKSLQLHELHHIRLLCHLLSPRICSNSCPLSWWCYLTISSSVALFSSCPQSFPTSVSFPVSQFLASGGQSTGASASAISPSNDYSGLISFRMDWLDLLAIQGTLMSLLQHHSLIPIK